MTVLQEGPTARSIDLFSVDPDEPSYLSGHLFGALALSPGDTPDEIPKISSHGLYTGLVLPGMPEFDDLQLMVDSFSQWHY